MSDLVNRLRGQYAQPASNFYGAKSYRGITAPISLEAADRIEDLELALQKIAERFEGKMNLHKDDCFAYQTVREAI